MAADEQGSHRPRWLDVAVTVLPPLSLGTALLVYFAWARRNAYATALGFDPGLLEDASVPGYLVRSVGAVWFPLLIALTGLLLWLGTDRILRRWARDGMHRRVITRVTWALPAGGVALVGSAALATTFIPVTGPYVSVGWPFLVALAVLVSAYAASLRRQAHPRTSRQDSVGHRWAITAVTGLLVALLLFDGMDRFAQVVGRGLAERVIEQPSRHTQPVLLYSTQDLQLDPATATRQALPSTPDTAYHYRYEGLRLVFVNGDHYFLIGRTWRPRSGTLIVLPRDGIRIEFPRGTAAAGNARQAGVTAAGS